MDATRGLNADDMRTLFARLGRHLASNGELVEIAVFGGSAIVLSFDYRVSTVDIDYLRISGNPQSLEKAAETVGAERGLPENWFNDAVRIFVSDQPDYRLLGDFPPASPGLRVFAATPRYILAMKIAAMRSSLETSDLQDVWHLSETCGIGTAEEARAVFQEYFPGKDLPRRNDLLLDDLFDSKAAGNAYSREIGW